MLVVIPARDEQATIGACLDSIADARAALGALRPEVAVAVVVVADACVDQTAALARARGADVIEIDAGAVGAARRAGVERGLAAVRGVDEASADRDGAPDASAAIASTWIASTDADSAVPRSWLLDHLAAAEAGADLLIGRVEPDPAHLSQAQLARWHREHDGLPVGEAIYGANLGMRADALRRVGGFAPVAFREDLDIVQRLRAAGAVVDAVRRPPVRTSGRTRSRVEGGFASYLAALRVE